MRVLIVDDEAIARKVMGYFLSAHGWEVKYTAGSLEALALADAWLPDVLICDWRLGAHTGADLARALRRRFPRLPVVFISGLPVEVLIPQAEDLPGCVFVQKPCDWENLDEVVREVTAPLLCEQTDAHLPARALTSAS